MCVQGQSPCVCQQKSKEPESLRVRRAGGEGGGAVCKKEFITMVICSYTSGSVGEQRDQLVH